jgi:hypothetical protein
MSDSRALKKGKRRHVLIVAVVVVKIAAGERTPEM